MEPEDLEPRLAKPKQQDFEKMSVEALRDYIADLQAEIARAEAAIAAKESWRDRAESFFKK